MSINNKRYAISCVSFQKSNIWKWNGQSSSKWTKMDFVKMELPRDTVIKAEFVMELRGEVNNVKITCVVHA